MPALTIEDHGAFDRDPVAGKPLGNDAADHARGARGRCFGPGVARQQPVDAHADQALVVADAIGTRLVLVRVVQFRLADRNGVGQIVIKRGVPLLEPALVEQLGFAG